MDGPLTVHMTAAVGDGGLLSGLRRGAGAGAGDGRARGAPPGGCGGAGAWHKRRQGCENAGRSRVGFVENTPLAVWGGRLLIAALVTAGQLVGDWNVPVSRVADAGWRAGTLGLVKISVRHIDRELVHPLGGRVMAWRQCEPEVSQGRSTRY
ncbi:hypothetical protein UK99_13235 [Frankia casuarinae]|nr:hypothetical protein UK99_13235 [Frankia casuarinae]